MDFILACDQHNKFPFELPLLINPSQQRRDRAALDMFEQFRPELVITDLSMPKMSGAELSSAIRDISNVPIIVLSVKGEERTKVDALDSGADDYVTKPFGMDELLARLDSAAVEQAVVCPMKPPGYHLEAANDYIAEACRRQRRFVGLARVDPHQGERAVRELERAIGELGLRGLFLHPWEETFRINAPRVDPLLATCAAHDKPVLIATGYPWVSEAAQVGDLARRYPNVSLLMTHGGQINISGLGQLDAFEVLRRNPNVAMETSGVYRQDFIQDVVSELGAQQVLFGSNSPRMDVRLEVERVRRAEVAESARQLMLDGNARRFFKLDSSAPPL